MPVSQQEKLYGLPGPQNSAVLMDIISKLKQELHQSKADNHKLVDQLNCLISLVKRAWSGEQGAILHLANIVGMEAPKFESHDVNRNTPVADKTRAVKNWERFAVKLLEREYAAIQEEIRERQRLHIQNRQLYINDVIEDHKQEMSKFHLHKKSATNVEDVDKQFLKIYNTQTKDPRRVRSAKPFRPRSGYRGQLSHAAAMAERAEVRVEDLLSQQGPQGMNGGGGDMNSNAAFGALYKFDTSENQRQFYRPREHFDDANRYRQNNLFDPDVIFSPELLAPQRETKGRPHSATSSLMGSGINLRNRPKSASTVFMTEAKPERPLKYETTRPTSGKKPRPGSGTASIRGRRHSAPARRPAPTLINRKELHNRAGLDHNNEPENDENEPELQNFESQSANNSLNNSNCSDEHNGDGDNVVKEKPPLKVKVKKGHPMDKFVEDLRHVSEMELDFKNSTLQLQKKLGLDGSGFIY
ncbi:uncharacterized protein LOC123548399 isoform X2 [Mercenaria mercenaria]|nr:uncharacterized protein LOC123548399 isoform X2 [Mercenaria mercenaria]XP_045191546.1 uncharacterized protein LOC123548399 isoform X2 [Mercenaria mercenaria]